jgi:hypothetical protein
MSRVRLFSVALALILGMMNSGCTSSTQPGIQVDKDSFSDTAEAFSPDTIDAGERDTTILLQDGEAYLKGHLSGFKTKPAYLVPAWKGQTLTAIVVPKKKGGNIRINQIIQPGGIAEGPFSDSLVYKFTSNGNMKLVIGGNQMAGTPYTGDFVLHIQIK